MNIIKTIFKSLYIKFPLKIYNPSYLLRNFLYSNFGTSIALSSKR